MTVLRSSFTVLIEDMIAYKKALGYSDLSYRFLYDFDRYCAEAFPNETALTQELVQEWCRKRDGESINGLNRRVAAIREFGRYLLSIGIQAYVLPPKMTAAQTIYMPHIFTDQELTAFFHGSDHLDDAPDDPLRPYIIPVIFRLIYCCGLRPREGLRIKSEDVDFESGRIFIREAKRHKDRAVVLSKDVLRLCVRYDQVRQMLCGSGEYFFPDKHGQIHNMPWLNYYFKRCWAIAGVTAFAEPKPRIYDFRHTFATNCMHNWMDEQVDLHQMLPYLSAYMGHSNFSSTAYYIHLLPERLKVSPSLDWGAYEELLPEVPA